MLTIKNRTKKAKIHAVFGENLFPAFWFKVSSQKNQLLGSHDINAFSFKLSTNVTKFCIYLQTPDEPT